MPLFNARLDRNTGEIVIRTPYRDLLLNAASVESLPLLKLDDYVRAQLEIKNGIAELEDELNLLKKRCAHQYADGTSMITPSPYGQGETYCPNCGNKWD